MGLIQKVARGALTTDAAQIGEIYTDAAGRTWCIGPNGAPGLVNGGGGSMRWLGIWSPSTQYEVGDVVLYPTGGGLYHIAIAVAPSVNVDPTTDTGSTTATIGPHWYSEY